MLTRRGRCLVRDRGNGRLTVVALVAVGSRPMTVNSSALLTWQVVPLEQGEPGGVGVNWLKLFSLRLIAANVSLLVVAEAAPPRSAVMPDRDWQNRCRAFALSFPPMGAKHFAWPKFPLDPSWPAV